ncbi:zinc finger MYM-type protein 1-like [Latimeria chalumnae]|uniref:zinc finger MYM-type protein 1-like n=1 Tax=Latimeria chalumnae TaxID=7897 RepID=UPI00313EE26A
MLFVKKSPTAPSLANPKKGFCDWKHSHPRIPDHENSPEHCESYITWKNFEMYLKKGGVIDDELQKSISSEKEKWRTILKIIVDAVLFCAKNNLGLRGSTDMIGNPNSGIFLNLLELISKYNPQLASHIASHKKGSTTYFSPTTQNEFINLLGSTVRREIISRIKQAKYFSIVFDCTPDVSHKEQMCQILRYIRIVDNECSVEESFIDFINTSEKMGSGLAAEIENKLCNDGLDIADCRGQGYDNGTNMAGKYRGVQARLAQVNELARFVPCAAHSLNLVGVHAASVSADMMLFFGTVQKLFTFFTGSTSRWEVLTKAVKVTLKGHSETRWSSKFRAVHSLHLQLLDVLQALYEIVEKPSNADAIFTAQSLIKQVDFQFICTLAMWDKILNLIERMNQIFQAKGLSVDSASKHIGGLKDALQHIQDTGIHNILKHAKELAEQMSLSAEFTEKRKRKVKRMASENVEDEGHLFTTEQAFKMQFNNVLDTLISQLQWRYEVLSEVASDFNFLTGSSLSAMPVSNLKKCAADLAQKYSKDLDALETVSEIESFKFQGASVMPDFSSATPLSLLMLIHKWSLTSSYPNIEIALRIFLMLPVTVASCERSFSKLKLIKTYLRSSIGQTRLSNLAILSFENALASAVNFDQVIDEFASLKA